MTEQYTVECTHDLCNCTVVADIETGEAYCSDYCRSSEDDSIESDACSCGHPPCDEV